MLALAIFLLAAAVSAPAASLPTHHVRPAVTSGQAKFVDSLPRFQTVRIGILLPIRDQAGLDAFFQDVYDPTSPSYRHFLTVPDFTARFAPVQGDYDAVVAFLQANGMTVTKLYPNRLLIDVTAPVSAIEDTFHLKMGCINIPPRTARFLLRIANRR